MAMDWPSERYVKLYIRDTTTWRMLPWQARAILPSLMRVVDRATGALDLAGEGAVDAVAVGVNMPSDVVAAGLEGLAKRGVVVVSESAVLLPNFVPAQEARASEAVRKRMQRDRENASRAVTRSHTEPKEVTSRHTASHAVTNVTPSSAQLSPAQPNPAQLSSLRTDADAPSPHEPADSADLSPHVTPGPTPSHEVTLSHEMSPAQEPPDGESQDASVRDMRELWNADADAALPRWGKTPPSRESHAKALLAAEGLEGWAAIIAKANESDFLCGRKPESTWRPPGVDWFLKPANRAKVVEGGYANFAPRPSAPPLQRPEATTCELCGTEGECAQGLCYGRCTALWAAAIESREWSFEQRDEWIAKQRALLPAPEPAWSPIPPPRLEAVREPAAKRPRAKLGGDPFAGMSGPSGKRKAVPA